MPKENIENIRHSLAHLLAAVVLELWPDTKLAIGPVIENGFYYDFEFSKPISEDDLPKIEKKMQEILPTWDKFEREEISEKEAKKLFADNPYKLELIQEYAGQELTLYKSGNFVDLCRGGHVKSAKNIDPEAFKLTSVAGAYWRGSENNKMLTRIYGVAFGTKKELDEYLVTLEEAKKRDHKKLGPQLGIFMFHETAPGMPYWLPKGVIILNELIDFWRKEHAGRGYQEISTPLVNKKELWEISGHWEHYKNDMFIADMGENEVYGIKPMNCPNAMIVFASQLRSYKDLPLRLSDTDILHRYELSGTLNGLFRVRSFRQDDSHNFITEDQIENEYGDIFDIAEKFYGIFGLNYRYRLGTRPENFLGDSKTWDKAEAALKRILDKRSGKENYETLEGDGAFYGPKVDILMKDVLGREWQMGTIQLDFQLPQRFNLSYIDDNGQKTPPVVIHRVIYGSLDRFIGILIEHYAGAFPLWLSPVQVVVAPISDSQQKYAAEFCDKLKEEDIRAELYDQNETIGKKIREAEMQKIPYITVVGDKEVKTGTVAVRKRGKGDEGQVKPEKFIELLKDEIENKK
jgi:threonyl-tRNA synthetase